MIRPLQSIINRGFKKDLSTLFGEGSKVEIVDLTYSTNKKTYVIQTKLFVTNVEESMEVYPSGLEMLVIDAWKMMCIDCPVIVISTMDVIV